MKVRVIWVVVLVTVLVAGGSAAWFLLRPHSRYADAVDSLPAQTARSTYTDWALVRAEIGAPEPGTQLTSDRIDALLKAGHDRGVVELSAVQDSSQVLSRLYGFTPFDLDWEIYGQSDQGAVDVLRFPDGFDMSGLDDRLRDLGYTEPSASDRPWTVTADALAELSLELTPIQQAVVLLPDEHLVLMAASAEYASQAADVVTGKASSLLGVEGSEALAQLPEEPVTATLWSRDFACRDLAMSQADAGDQARAQELIDAAGTVSPLAGLVMAQESNGRFAVGLWFANDRQAEENLPSRRALASGDAPGQGGSFADRFSVADASVDGRLVTLQLDPKVDRSLMTDIASGPVLFATC